MTRQARSRSPSPPAAATAGVLQLRAARRPPGQHLAPAGRGRPLPGALREKMERALGHDFSRVRIHEGTRAESLGAIAYTRGTDLHFAPGRYSPSTRGGQELIGHELAHVVQQHAGRVAVPRGKGAPINGDPALEAEAERLGRAAAIAPSPASSPPMQGNHGSADGGGPRGAIQAFFGRFGSRFNFMMPTFRSIFKQSRSSIWTKTPTKSRTKNLYDHYKKHRSGFGDLVNVLDYFRRASAMRDNPPEGTLIKKRPNGDVVHYHPPSNTFLVTDKHGYPRTFFKPDPSEHGYPSNIDYFNAQ